MAHTDITMTRRKLLGAVATVGAAGAGAGAGTAALFSDTETSTASTSAGTLNLTLDGQDTTVQFLLETGIAPGDSGTSSVTLQNTGSVTGYVDVEATVVTNYENGCPGNEGSADGTCGDPGEGQGELQTYLETEGFFQNGPSLWGPTTVSNEPTQGTVYDVDYQLGPGASDDFTVDWTFQSTAGDDAQTDSVLIELTFRLDQATDTGL